MMLQVDIPNVAMERYSIMFGAVLEQGPPSLIARRQGPLERLKALDTNKHQPVFRTTHIIVNMNLLTVASLSIRPRARFKLILLDGQLHRRHCLDRHVSPSSQQPLLI